MKKRIMQAITGTVISLSLLTACGSRNAAPVESEQSVSSSETERAVEKVTVAEPVYCVREETLFNNDGSNSYTFGLSFKYEYDARGNKVKQTMYNSSGAVSNWSEYEYTNSLDACRVKETTTHCNGTKTLVEYGYNADGDITERVYYRGNSLILTRFFDAKADYRVITQMLYQAQAAIDRHEIIRYISYDNDVVTEFATAQYDANGNRIEENIYFADGSLMYSYEYEYDTAGNMTKEAVYDASGNLLNLGQFEYSYDQHGNILEKREYLDGDFVALIKYDYIEMQLL